MNRRKFLQSLSSGVVGSVLSYELDIDRLLWIPGQKTIFEYDQFFLSGNKEKMTFLERYKEERTWHGKAMIMEIYHLAMSQRSGNWTVTKTAEHFEVSIGLVSENLRLAHALHTFDSLIKQETRQDALKWLNHHRNYNGGR
jgi:hypothetical protein